MAPTPTFSFENRRADAPRRPAHKQLVFDTSSWERMLYERRRVQGGALDASVAQVDEVVAAHEVAKAGATADDLRAAEVRLQTAKVVDAFGSEVFGRLYGQPDRLAAPATDGAWAKVAHDVLDQLPEFEDLRATVAGDPDFSALASADLCAALAPKLAGVLKEVEREEQEGGEGGEPGQGDGQGKAPGAGNGGLPGAKDLLRAALRGAARNAAAKTDDRREALAGLAPGLEHVPATHEQPDPARMALAEQLGKDKSLREILRRAGKLQRIQASRRQQRRSRDAREEVVDIERGADLSRLLPSQLGALKHPKARLLALRSLVERTALQYRLEGHEPLGRGPIVLLLDESGSMGGDPHVWARAVGIATLGIGAREKRAVTVIGFDTRVRSVVHLAKDGRALSLKADGSERAPLGGVAQAALLVAGQTVAGGTDYTAPLKLALSGLPAGLQDDRADLVFVTDGACFFPDEIRDQLVAAKARGLRIFGLTLNGGSASEAVREICDHVVDLDKTKNNKDEEVANALPG